MESLKLLLCLMRICAEVNAQMRYKRRRWIAVSGQLPVRPLPLWWLRDEAGNVLAYPKVQEVSVDRHCASLLHRQVNYVNQIVNAAPDV